jgi:hypothetical protein
MLCVLTRKYDRHRVFNGRCYIYIHQRPSGATLCKTTQGLQSKEMVSSRDLSILTIQRISINDEKRELAELGPNYWRFLSIPFFRNRGRGKCGVIPHNPALRPPQTSLFTRPWISCPTNRAYSMFGFAEKTSVVRPESSGISICRR